MEKNIEEYQRYIDLSKRSGSKPIRYVDAFEEEGEIPNATIKIGEIQPRLIFSGLPNIVNISVRGKGTVTLIFGRRSVVENIQITAIQGDLTIFFGPYCEVKNLIIQSFDLKNYLHFGVRATINTGNFLLQGDNKEIFVGHDCMFSTNIFARTSDSHSIFSYSSGNRINDDESIVIGDHVWIGRNVTFNKGAKVADDVVIGQNSVVSGALTEKHCSYGGVPARKIKEDLTWDRTKVENRNEIVATYKWRPQVEVINNFLVHDSLLSIKDRTDSHIILREKYLVNKPYRWIETLSQSE